MKILIANDKGGVGKSTLAHVIALREKFSGRPFALIEFDSRSKLSNYFGPDTLTNLSPWGQQAEVAFDELLDLLAGGRNTIVDFGAQTFALFCQWARETGFVDVADATDFVLVVPYTADQEAISAAIDVFREAASIFSAIRVVPVANLKDGDPRLLAGVPAYDRMNQILRGCLPLNVAALPNDAFPALAARGWGFERIVGATPQDIAAASGLSLARGNRTIRAVRGWLEELLTNLAALDGGATPTPVLAPKVAAKGGPPQYNSDSPAVIDAPTPDPNEPVGDFDEEFYLARNPDVAAAVRRGEFASGLEHYRVWGRREERPATPPPVVESEQTLFNETFYLAANPDVALAVQRGLHLSGYEHYVTVGRQEGRRARFRQL